MKKNTVLLVDVDNTLLFGEDGELNEDLVNALKVYKITHIRLFTNMTLRELVDKVTRPVYLTRPELVKRLAEAGIEVTMVATPADVIYGKGPGKAYEEIYLPQYLRVLNGVLTEATYYADAEFREQRRIYNELHERTCDLVKDDADKTNKSLLFEYLLDHKTADETIFIVFDDDFRHLDAILATARGRSGIKVKCIQVSVDSDQAYFESELGMVLSRPGSFLKNLLPRRAKTPEPNLASATQQDHVGSLATIEESVIKPRRKSTGSTK